MIRLMYYAHTHTQFSATYITQAHPAPNHWSPTHRQCHPLPLNPFAAGPCCMPRFPPASRYITRDHPASSSILQGVRRSSLRSENRITFCQGSMTTAALFNDTKSDIFGTWGLGKRDVPSPHTFEIIFRIISE